MSLKDKMKELKLSFVEKLPEYLDKVQTGYKRLSENPQDQTKDVLQDIFLQLHSVKGAAATFGLAHVSEISKLAEKEASDLIDLYKKEGNGENFLTAISSFQKNIFDLAGVIKDVQADQEDNITESSFDLSTLETDETEYPVEQKLIFICDDDPESVEHLRLQLKYLGYNVVPFLDTASLLEAAIKRHPAAIVMDITFPKGQRSGPEVVRHLRSKLDRLPPIVFISSRSDYQARYEAVQAGGDAYYVKPLKTLDLVHTLDELTITVKHEPNKVLIVDDEPEIAKFHSAILNEAKMLTYELYSPENILEVLDTFKPDLVLMDMHMPTYSGREVAKVIRQIPEYLSLPIIYLSSEMDVVKQAFALRAGAEGFLTKPISPVTLINEVNVRVQRMQDLRSLMVKDSLTGLFNHTFIQRFLDATFANAVRTKQPCCVVMIDVDNFKKVNDTYGHPMGDQVLIAISRLLRQSVREGDAVGRYGGEEFVMVLNNLTKETAFRVVDNIRSAFSQLKFEHSDKVFHCTFSAGISMSSEYGNTLDLMEDADQALYRSKQNGRNQVRFAKKG